MEQSGLIAAIISAVTGFGDGDASDRPFDAAPDYHVLAFEIGDQRLEVPPDQVDARVSQSNGLPSLEMRFETVTAAWVASVTHGNIGQPMAMMVCGEEISAPIIQEVIAGGEIQITGANLVIAELSAIAGRINGESPCPARPVDTK